MIPPNFRYIATHGGDVKEYRYGRDKIYVGPTGIRNGGTSRAKCLAAILFSRLGLVRPYHLAASAATAAGFFTLTDKLTGASEVILTLDDLKAFLAHLEAK